MTREQRIVRRAAEELGKPQPDLSYVRGMLESLVEDEVAPSGSASPSPAPAAKPAGASGSEPDEAADMEAETAAMIARMQSGNA